MLPRRAILLQFILALFAQFLAPVALVQASAHAMQDPFAHALLCSGHPVPGDARDDRLLHHDNALCCFVYGSGTQIAPLLPASSRLSVEPILSDIRWMETAPAALAEWLNVLARARGPPA